MPWKLPATARQQACDEKLDMMGDRLDRMTSQVEHVFANLDRLSSELRTLRERVDTAIADRRDQAAQLSTLRTVVAELQARSGTTADAVSALWEDHGRAADAAAEMRGRSDGLAGALEGQAAHLATLEERGERQERSLGQARADLTRMERQAAADLAELRTANMALARAMLKVNGERTDIDSPEGSRRSEPGQPRKRLRDVSASEGSAGVP